MNTCAVAQRFGENANPFYATAGYKGHTGQDTSCGWGTPIYSPFDGYVYKVYSPDYPAADGYTALFMIVDDGIECFEFSIGHCNPSVTVGTQVKKGDLIGHEANHGIVYSGNLRITLAMQAAGDQRGHHRHYQKRPVKRTMPMLQSREYLIAERSGISRPYRDQVGYYYEVWAPGNGYNGCTDPAAPVLRRDLWYGCQGYDVYVLQRFLKKQGLFLQEPTGYFGPVTGSAVRDFQILHNIKPVLGYCGALTRPFINIPTPDLLGL